MNRDAALSRLRRDGPVLAALVLVWMLLWGTLSWANLLSGIVVAVAVMALLPLPSVPAGLRLRPLPAVVFFTRFAYDLLSASIHVAILAVRPRPPHGAIISVQARSDSDLLLTMLSQALCLVPGSIVIDLDREKRLVSLHVIDIPTYEDLRREKLKVLAQEERIVRAFGRPEDIAALGRRESGAATSANHAAQTTPEERKRSR